MKKRIIIVAAICLIFSTQIWSKNFMWEIQGGKNTAYLLGSIHTMPKDVYPLDEQIETAFQESDVLVVDVDATTLDQNEVSSFIGLNAVYQDSINLQSVIDEELFNNISLKMQELGLTEEQLKAFKPWFVSLNLGLGALQKIDITTGLGIDLHFLNKAHESEMPIKELETAISQLEALSSMDDQTQIDYLQYSIDDYEQSTTIFMDMLEAWKTGDTKKMKTVTKVKMLELEEKLPGIIDFYHKMFTERDEKILVKIEKLLNNKEEKVYFIIIGAVHLVGEDGLIKLLNNNGYKTKQY
ncbi:MAG: TraB/GumN family protein [Candidatus Cloacimonetes bacterium]|jgi:uncharacterized protein YbaP (TraB family)|nr:TraB/GumN family protein [Candidatus Cloacimonadota bacterium]